MLCGVRFIKCSFRAVAFCECSDGLDHSDDKNGNISGAAISRCVFEECDFEFANFSGVSFLRCAFISCALDNAIMLGTDFIGCKMTGSSLGGENAAVNIEGGDWSYTKLNKMRFKKRDMGDISFRGANLFGVHFDECRLCGCNFDNSYFSETKMLNCDIRGASFEYVNLPTVDFRGSRCDVGFCIALARASGLRYE
ncbi:MAG: pentapeptide repeat-containing protein [Eubacteriales bacterium]